jgi:hypothetical protein
LVFLTSSRRSSHLSPHSSSSFPLRLAGVCCAITCGAGNGPSLFVSGPRRGPLTLPRYGYPISSNIGLGSIKCYALRGVPRQQGRARSIWLANACIICWFAAGITDGFLNWCGSRRTIVSGVQRNCNSRWRQCVSPGGPFIGRVTNRRPHIFLSVTAQHCSRFSTEFQNSAKGARTAHSTGQTIHDRPALCSHFPWYIRILVPLFFDPAQGTQGPRPFLALE